MVGRRLRRGGGGGIDDRVGSHSGDVKERWRSGKGVFGAGGEEKEKREESEGKLDPTVDAKHLEIN